jgi:hypothetical protein
MSRGSAGPAEGDVVAARNFTLVDAQDDDGIESVSIIDSI